MSTSSSATACPQQPPHLPAPAHTLCLSSFGNHTELGEGGKPWGQELNQAKVHLEGWEDRGKSPPLCVWSSKLVCPADVWALISYCRNCSLLLAINWRILKWATWKKE